MAKRPAKKSDKQLDLPAPPTTTQVLPMQLQIGDRLTDATGEWEVIGRPYTTNGGKNAHVGSSGRTSPASPRRGCGKRMRRSW